MRICHKQLLNSQKFLAVFYSLFTTTKYVSKIGVNVNQLARLANTTGSVTPEEMKELKGMIKEIFYWNADLKNSCFSSIIGT